MKRFLQIWLVLSCLTCAFFAAKAWTLRGRLETNVQTHASAQRFVSEEILRLKKQIAAADAEQKAGEALLPNKRTKKATELSDRERLDRGIPLVEKMRLDPRNQQALRLDNRRRVQWQYGDLFTELKLTREKLEKLKTLLCEKADAGLDAMNYSVAQGLSSSSEASQNAVKQAESSIDRDVAQLLGETDFKTYQEYDRVWRDTHRLGMFQAALAENNLSKLEKHQLQALATACCDLADESRNPDYAAIAKDPGGATATRQIVQRVSDQLTPEQIRAFVAYREELDAAEKASEAFIRGEAPLPAPVGKNSM